MKKNRISIYIVSGLILLAVLGVMSSLFSNPLVFIQRMAVILLVIGAVYFFYRRSNKMITGKKEQRAFIKAAKKSKRRFNHKDNLKNIKSSNGKSLTSLKKPKKKTSSSPSHLTVIEGRKGKKKNRASF